jgi:hypothetical protein
MYRRENMLVTLRKKFFLRIAEVYFSTDYAEKVPDADIVIYLQSSKYRDGCREFHTLLMDLDKEKQEFLAGLGKRSRERVRQAARETEFYMNNSPSDEEIMDFKEFYNVFAKNKGIGKCNYKKLKTLRDNNALVISAVYDKEKQRLVSHAYVVDGVRARGLYSASHFRLNTESSQCYFIGRANRYLHWMDIKYFKENGFSTYDFGGLALDGGNSDKKNIDQFKMGFGGRVVTEYNLCLPKSILGKLALIFRKY